MSIVLPLSKGLSELECPLGGKGDVVAVSQAALLGRIVLSRGFSRITKVTHVLQCQLYTGSVMGKGCAYTGTIVTFTATATCDGSA